SLDERYFNLSKTLEAAKHESLEWKRKYEIALSKQKASEKQASSEVANLKARSSAAKARLTAAREQTLSAQEEAGEWKRKYDVAVKEAKSALEKTAVVQYHACKQTQIMKTCKAVTVRIKLNDSSLDNSFRRKSRGGVEQEAKIKDKARKIEQAEQRVTTLNMELKVKLRLAGAMFVSKKLEGGLGIKSLYTWNVSLIAKHIWNIVSEKDVMGEMG
ncbi:hypothetical protein Tco_1515300, partial [Tanacetum coccineum]